MPDTNIRKRHRRIVVSDMLSNIAENAIQKNISDSFAEKPAPPLLLMPMRLEYRIVQKNNLPIVANTRQERDELKAILASGKDNSLAAKNKRKSEERKQLSKWSKKGINVEKATILNTKEIWFRWYPDESFSEKGIETVQPDEGKFLESFRKGIGNSSRWWDTKNPDVSEQWQILAQTIGPARAVHLLRSNNENTNTPENRLGRITALPRRVALFAINGQTVSKLASGKLIPKNTNTLCSEVSYTPKAIDSGGWIADFRVAVEMGMGIKLSNEDIVRSALNADWIIAVGLHSGAANNEIDTLIQDLIANGEFEFLPQDAPTNNSPSETSVYISPYQDVKHYLEIATDRESGKLKTTPKTISKLMDGTNVADKMAAALGIAPETTRNAPRASNSMLEDARAMLRVIGPALIDEAIDNLTFLEGVDENKFVESIANSMSARGVFSPMRFGRNAFGMVTITDINAIDLEFESDEKKAKVLCFLKKYSEILRDFLLEHAENVVPVQIPDDPESSEKMDAILKSNRTSVRLDIATAGSEKTNPIGCPYVKGIKTKTHPKNYLKMITSTALKDLPDPDESDKTWPILYRLARLSLTKNIIILTANIVLGEDECKSLRTLERLSMSKKEEIRRKTEFIFNTSIKEMYKNPSLVLKDIPTEKRKKLIKINSKYYSALLHLKEIASRPQGIAELEILLLETIDLFQHRIDSFGTGLANEKLSHIRKIHPTELHAGYFGFIGKLREESQLDNDGFILAPSTPQATAAAIMRSAYTRHKSEGAFAINLGSKQVRIAQTMLDMLQRGNSLGEVLGIFGERWIHDQGNGLDRIIPFLRQECPIKNISSFGGDDEQPIGRRIFDGLDFLEGNLERFNEFDTQEERLSIEKLHTAIEKNLDSLTDLIMAEAVYQRTIGSPDNANAWLQVLSGGQVPGEPTFIKTQRHGQGSTHRISLLVNVPDTSDGKNPRAIAEPSLANMASEALTDFSTATTIIKVKHRTLTNTNASLNISFSSDLGLEPLDFVVGGESELKLRLHQYFARELIEKKYLADIFQPQGNTDQFIKNNLEFDLGLGKDDNSEYQSLKAKVDMLRSVWQDARVLEPSDMNASVSPDHELDEKSKISLNVYAINRLLDRVESLKQKLSKHRSSLADARTSFIYYCGLLRDALTNPQDSESNPQDSESTIKLLDQANRELNQLRQHLWDVSFWSEPTALAPFNLEDAINDLELLDHRIQNIEKRLKKRFDTLELAMSETDNIFFNSLSDTNNALNTVTIALQKVLDGNALPILPPYDRTDALRPDIKEIMNPGKSEQLSFWADIRPAVAKALVVSELILDLKAHHANPESATGANELRKGDEEAQSDEEAPRSFHYGVYLDKSNGLSSNQPLAGLVIDEWAEIRPSQTQMAGIAINYDSPQSEPPNILLLCIPPNQKHNNWNDKNAAEMVLETLNWMKIRTLSTQDKIVPSSLLPGALQIPYRCEGKTCKARVPKQSSVLLGKHWSICEEFFEINENGVTSVPSTENVNERLGFYRMKEHNDD